MLCLFAFHCLTCQFEQLNINTLAVHLAQSHTCSDNLVAAQTHSSIVCWSTGMALTHRRARALLRVGGCARAPGRGGGLNTWHSDACLYMHQLPTCPCVIAMHVAQASLQIWRLGCS